MIVSNSIILCSLEFFYFHCVVHIAGNSAPPSPTEATEGGRAHCKWLTQVTTGYQHSEQFRYPSSPPLSSPPLSSPPLSSPSFLPPSQVLILTPTRELAQQVQVRLLSPSPPLATGCILISAHLRMYPLSRPFALRVWGQDSTERFEKKITCYGRC